MNTIKVNEGENVTVVLVVTLTDGSLLTQAITSGIVMRVYQPQSEWDQDPCYTETLTVADTVFDTLQNDGIWSKANVGGDGYGFRHTIDGTRAFTEGGTKYRVEYEFTTTSTLDGTFRKAIPVELNRMYST